MPNQTFDMINEYNNKAMLTLRAFGDLNVATAEWFVSKQLELSKSMMETVLASGKEIAAAKTPAEAAQVSSQLMQSMTESMTGFVKESSANAVIARDELKVVIDDAVKLNSEYAGKAFESGVETIKKTAQKAA